MITLKDIKENKELDALIRGAQKQLNAIGYTEHGHRHISIVSKRAGDILEKLGYPERTVELTRIAGYMHDIGNCVNRVDHAHTGAILAYNILKEMGMPIEEITEIMMAIGNHDENTGTAVSDISAALILADKSNVKGYGINRKSRLCGLAEIPQAWNRRFRRRCCMRDQPIQVTIRAVA